MSRSPAARRPLLAAIALFCVVLLVVGTFVGAFAAPASAAERPYLVLGDSVSAGYQPDRGEDPAGGYVPRVVEGMGRAGTALAPTNLACTGETTVSMRDGSLCDYAAGDQQSAALAFLRAHPDTALITLSLGANDLLRCTDGRGSADSVDQTCLREQSQQVRPRLASILTELRRAAPQARIVVLDYYDPFQAAHLLGTRVRIAGDLSGVVRTTVNISVRGAARDAGATVAYVTEPFDEGWHRRVELPGYGRVPIRVARICEWTWMCDRVDIHPNDQGYEVIGDAVLTSLLRRS